MGPAPPSPSGAKVLEAPKKIVGLNQLAPKAPGNNFDRPKAPEENLTYILSVWAEWVQGRGGGTSSTAPAHQPLGSANAETTPAGAKKKESRSRKAGAKKQQPDGMSHRGGGTPRVFLKGGGGVRGGRVGGGRWGDPPPRSP